VSHERCHARGSVLVPSRWIGPCAIREIWWPSSIKVVTAEATDDPAATASCLPRSSCRARSRWGSASGSCNGRCRRISRCSGGGWVEAVVQLHGSDHLPRPLLAPGECAAGIMVPSRSAGCRTSTNRHAGPHHPRHRQPLSLTQIARPFERARLGDRVRRGAAGVRVAGPPPPNGSWCRFARGHCHGPAPLFAAAPRTSSRPRLQSRPGRRQPGAAARHGRGRQPTFPRGNGVTRVRPDVLPLSREPRERGFALAFRLARLVGCSGSF
jgi:hypothetical protein